MAIRFVPVPRLQMPSTLALPQMEYCRGTIPSHAAKSRPFRKAAPLPMAATRCRCGSRFMNPDKTSSIEGRRRNVISALLRIPNALRATLHLDRSCRPTGLLGVKLLRKITCLYCYTAAFEAEQGDDLPFAKRSITYWSVRWNEIRC
jgi:hypothetical protein